MTHLLLTASRTMNRLLLLRSYPGRCDYLLLSAADTAGWDSVLKDAKDAALGYFI
jgi:hypothetical protein